MLHETQHLYDSRCPSTRVAAFAVFGHHRPTKSATACDADPEGRRGAITPPAVGGASVGVRRRGLRCAPWRLLMADSSSISPPACAESQLVVRLQQRLRLESRAADATLPRSWPACRRRYLRRAVRSPKHAAFATLSSGVTLQPNIVSAKPTPFACDRVIGQTARLNTPEVALDHLLGLAEQDAGLCDGNLLRTQCRSSLPSRGCAARPHLRRGRRDSRGVKSAPEERGHSARRSTE